MIFTCDDTENISITSDEDPNILIYGTPFYGTVYRSYNTFLKLFAFWPTLYITPVNVDVVKLAC